MATGFKVTQSVGNYQVDVDDILMRREYFSDGSLWTWGRNDYGQLGDGTTTSRSSPGTTAGGGTNWKQVAGGPQHTAAIKADGTLWICGFPLGDGTTNTSSSPVTTAGGGTNWKQVSGGSYHTAAIKTDGTLWTWGYNNYGGLGDGTTTSRTSPVTTAGGGTNWKQVACGDYHTAAIKTDGTLWTWGRDDYGQLGIGGYFPISKTSPGTTYTGGTNWKQVAGGERHTAAIKTDGTLWTWGDNSQKQLGRDDAGAKNWSPGTTSGGGTNWKQVSGGSYHTAAIKTDGTLWTWGYNGYGQLGDGTLSSRSSPVKTAGGGTNWKQVACGSYHTSAIKTDGTLWNCGYNGAGQLGDGTTTHRLSPVTTAGGGTNWKQVACATFNTSATTNLSV